tara:strand:+ start:5543 stop:7681 length:2139 start_codon:yes stop_codon:yes gene_type:complete
MNDPVMDPDGNTYEKKAILEWLKIKKESPVTRNPLHASDLKPNRALKDAIQSFLQGYSEEKKSNTVCEHTYDTKSVNIKCVSSDKLLMLEFENPEGIDRHSLDLAMVIDISGSMTQEATITNSSGTKESHGLSLLDIVKHGARTIINCMGPNDRVSIITYSDDSKVVFPLRYMTDENKLDALSKLNTINTEGCTNIWAGLEEGMKVLDYNKNNNQRSLLLLSDGQPNVIPPRGHIPMLHRFMDKHPDCCNINTYGFGYNVDSKLLSDLAKYGNGGYYMIPESSFLGTIFEHSFANISTSFTSNLKIRVEKLEGNNLISAKNTYNVEDFSWGKQITFGSLQYGQVKNFILEFEKPLTDEQIELYIEFNDYRTNKKYTTSIKNKVVHDNKINLHYLRSNMKHVMDSCMELLKNDSSQENLTKATSILHTYIDTVRTYEIVFPNKYLSDLVKDLSGQTTLAFSNKEWYNKWGCHYIRSLTLAHMNQQCNNFKDPGVQHFGGQLFKKIRDSADDIFCNLDPPKPSIKKRNNYQRKAVSTMRDYNNANAPCFHGNSTVLMFDNHYKKVSHIVKGDIVKTASGKMGIIRCVVKTIISKGKLPMVGFNKGLLVTGWHPIRLNLIWCLPKTVGETYLVKCDAIYSFLLEEDNEPIMIINGIECVSLAHNLKGDVIQHQYYGSDRIVKDLMKKDGWNKGLVVLDKQIFQRDQLTNMVTSIC